MKEQARVDDQKNFGLFFITTYIFQLLKGNDVVITSNRKWGRTVTRVHLEPTPLRNGGPDLAAMADALKKRHGSTRAPGSEGLQ